MQNKYPKVSVITPSYNQGQYIEQTINSVLGQQYPNLEYIIMDGGSSDQSVEVIRKYSSNLDHWQSKKDGGQAAAINEGFSIATGDILCWINSDDYYLPGTFSKVVEIIGGLDTPVVLFGNCLHFDENGNRFRGSNVKSRSEDLDLLLCDYVIQPSSFWNKQAWDIVGNLDEGQNFAFDWDWFIRAKQKGVQFIPVSDYFSVYRIHESHKSAVGGKQRLHELFNIYRFYSGEKIARDFRRWQNLCNGFRLLRDVTYFLYTHKMRFACRIVNKLLLPRTSFYVFRNILHM